MLLVERERETERECVCVRERELKWIAAERPCNCT